MAERGVDGVGQVLFVVLTSGQDLDEQCAVCQQSVEFSEIDVS